jgi:hypothetical protein
MELLVESNKYAASNASNPSLSGLLKLFSQEKNPNQEKLLE